MRRIVATVFQTLDGVMQAPGGDSEDPTHGFSHGGWQMGYEDPEANAAIGKAFAPPYALLLGRRTYDIFASYWPYVEGEMAEMGKAFTACDKYVLTRSDKPLEWENSHRVASMDALAEVKRRDGPELRIWGSTTLYPQLLKAALLDELNIFTFPLVLGGGKRLFGDGTPADGFTVKDSGSGSAGVSWATLEPGAKIPDSPPNIPPPNPRDTARRQAIREGTW
jgi:dihydrofolate reductase